MASSRDVETAFQTWTAAPAGSAAESYLLDTLLRHARAQILGVIRAKNAASHTRSAPEDLEDACQVALLKLWRKLQAPGVKIRSEKIAAYVNASARNAFYDLLRKANPSWFTMAACILWRVRNSQAFVPVERDGDLLYALPETLTGAPDLDHPRLETLCEELRRERDWSKVPLQTLLIRLLREVGQPVPLDLLSHLCLLCTGAQRATVSLDSPARPNLRLLDLLEHRDPTPEQAFQEGQLLLWVWNELAKLPDRQRQVCGLNLDSAVGLRLEIFLLRGVATRVSYEMLIRPILLRHLPYFPPIADDDIVILLRIPKKKVSNRRISAQRRLARRILDWLRGSGRTSLHSASWKDGVRSKS